MRVLWFTNEPLPAVHNRMCTGITGTGHWMSSLLESLLESPGIELEVAGAYPGMKDDQFTANGVKYFTLGQPKRPGIFFDCRPQDLAGCASLVRERVPDVVHIH